MKLTVYALLLLVAFSAPTAQAKSCFWSTVTLRSCDKNGPLALSSDEILQTFQPETRANTFAAFSKTQASSQTATFYSYKLKTPVDRIRFAKDGLTVLLFYNGQRLLAAATTDAQARQITERLEMPLTNKQDIAYKLRYGQTVTQAMLQHALGKPDAEQYFLSPAYESPVYQFTYGPASYFAVQGTVLHYSPSETDAREYIKLISAYDPLEEEIVLTQADVPAATHPTLSIWDKSAPELVKLLKNKTREYALYSIETVSDRDGIVRSAKGGEYALVEYHDGGEYRKFLFKAETPQTFITAAANAADALAVNRRYGVSLDISLADFLRSFESAATAVPTEEETLSVYQMPYTDAGSKTPRMLYFVFEQDLLTLTFDSRAKLDAHLKKLQDQRKKQAEAEAKRQAEAQKAAEEAKPKPRPKPYTAILSGGTVTDRMYRPIVTHPKDGKIQPPKIIPEVNHF